MPTLSGHQNHGYVCEIPILSFPYLVVQADLQSYYQLQNINYSLQMHNLEFV